MEPKIAQFGNRGMQQDTSISKASNEFAFENRNIRITAINGDTLLSVTNEKGPKKIDIKNKSNETCQLEGTYLGSYVLNKYIVVFTTSESNDFIYRLEDKGDYFQCVTLFCGDLSFSSEHPIEATGYYESENIQKIYWVDGLNPNRFINIANSEAGNTPGTLTEADKVSFVSTVNTLPTVEILKQYTGLGSFPSGVIQYFITYYNKYGAETPIVWSSDINYITFQNRGGKADETISCNFKLTISNIDTSFEYLRVYSAKRTSLDGPPEVQIVSDAKITGNTLEIIDSNISQTLIDANNLYFIGGENFSSETLEQKDGTLFLGNIKLLNPNFPDTNLFVPTANTGGFVTSVEQTWTSVGERNRRFYDYDYQLAGSINGHSFNGLTPVPTVFNNNSSSKLRYFKAGETYRFAIQFLHKSGKWSAPKSLGDYTVPTENPYVSRYPTDNWADLKVPILKYDGSSMTWSTGEEPANYEWIKYRILRAETSPTTRRVLAQGMVNPTVFNYGERCNNSPYAISSWCARPELTKNTTHFQSITDPIEIQCNTETSTVTSSDPDEKIYYTFIVILNSHLNTGLFNKQKRVVRVFGTTAPGSLSTIQPQDVELVDYTEFDENNWDKAIVKTNEFLLGKSYAFSIGPNGSARTYVQKDDNYDNNTSHSTEYGVISSLIPVVHYDSTHDYDDAWCVYYEVLSDSGMVLSKQKEYFVDSSIVSFNSPELETVGTMIDSTKLKFRIVGIAEISSSLTGHQLEVSQGVAPFARAVEKSTSINSNADTLTSGWFYTDGTPMLGVGPLIVNDKWNSEFSKKYASTYSIYMWHKTGKIVGENSGWTNIDEITGSELKHKIFGTERFAHPTRFFSKGNIELPICQPSLFSSNEIVPVKLEVPEDENSNKYVYYYGNYDKLLAVTKEYGINYRTDFDTSDPATSLEEYIEELKKKLEENPNTTLDVNDILKELVRYDYFCTDPIRIKYKSTKEVVFSFGQDENNKKYTLPFISGSAAGGGQWVSNGSNYEMQPDTQNPSAKWPWGGMLKYIREPIEITNFSANNPYVFIGELYRDFESSPYGEDDDNTNEKIKWIPCSQPTNLFTNAVLEGDTFYQRWDCLKTYPFTEEDENSVVDITSFMVESHINLDGRCDINRGGTEITSYRPEKNFNLMNDVYSQENNLFEYTTLDEKFDLSTFKNQITWSLTKTPTDDIDTWTRITLLNLLNLDGTYGAITKLSCINNALFAFQDRAISRINYNDRMQISTEQNTPIEVQNSGKVQGYTYISKQIGCKNKWSICQSAAGIYFTDTEKKSLYRINSEGLLDVSANAGMSMWFKDNISNTPWKPTWEQEGSAKLSYDAITNDIYISTDKECIVYNEGLQAFTSFMPYKMTPLLLALDGKSLMLDASLKLYKMFAGDYNVDKNGDATGYSIKYKVNPEPLANKTFTNLNLIADYTDDNKELVGITPFSHLSIWNEYQFGETNLEDLNQYLPEDQKNKFRIWRIQLPRDKKNSRYGLDRIQNPWVYIELNKTFNWEDKEEEEIEKEKNLMTFHSLLVKYFK